MRVTILENEHQYPGDIVPLPLLIHNNSIGIYCPEIEAYDNDYYQEKISLHTKVCQGYIERLNILNSAFKKAIESNICRQEQNCGQ